MDKKLKVLIVATEASPYVKSGGLGDVIGSLPQALRKIGVDARVVFPWYNSAKINRDECKFIESYSVPLGWRSQWASIFEMENTVVPTYLVQNDFYFGRDRLYGYGDDHERFSFFTKAAIEILNYIDFIPDLIHFNDWQTAIGPVYHRDTYSRFTGFKDIKTLLTIHNLQYQGIFDRSVMSAMELNDGYFVSDKFEFNGRVSLMKGGIVYADGVSTVSPTYAQEIQTPTYGHSLDGVLREYSYKLSGILNGIDTDVYNPETDKEIFANFSATDENLFDNKRENKRRLQQELSLEISEAPMVAIISRLVDQKGLDLVAAVMDEMLAKGCQLVVLGTGDGRYEHLFANYGRRFPTKVSANIYFSEDLAHKIYAAADMFLMPSMFEPCGLGQLIAMRYGTVPIVRHTGGLVDTVSHFNEEDGTGNGFVFNDYIHSGLMWAIDQSLAIYFRKDNEIDKIGTSKTWKQIVKNAITSDFSWEKSAMDYRKIYENLCNIK